MLVQIVQGMLDSNAVTASNITDGAVTGSKIAANAITTDKIAPGAVNASSITSLATLSAVSLSASQLTVSAGTSAVPAISPADDTNTGLFFPAADTIAFTEGGAEAMRIDSSGNVGIGLTPTSRNNTRLQIVDGIGFPATQVASSDANTLDDYEEGEWTGTLEGLTTNPTTPVTAIGSYTKIGRLVFANIAFSGFSNVGASGGIRITGLPFSADPPVATGNAMFYDCATYGAGSANVSPYVTSGVIDFYYMSSNGGYFRATHNAGTNRFMLLSVTYRV